MREIADWLKKLGMTEYAERFAENCIDYSVLRDLTDQDLKDLGVALGHRRKRCARDWYWLGPKRGPDLEHSTDAGRHRHWPCGRRRSYS